MLELAKSTRGTGHQIRVLGMKLTVYLSNILILNNVFELTCCETLDLQMLFGYCGFALSNKTLKRNSINFLKLCIIKCLRCKHKSFRGV